MSSTTQKVNDRFTREDLDNIVQFYSDYMSTELAELVEKYPSEKRSITVDVAGKLWRYDSSLALDVEEHPDTFQPLFEEAVTLYDQNAGQDLENVTVRFANSIDNEKKVDEIRRDDVDQLVTLKGQISKASGVRPVVEEAAWECQRCGTYTRVPIEEELTEPHECQGCERQGPFQLDYHESDVEDHQLVRVKQPPEEATNSAQMGGEIDANVTGDLAGEIDAGERAEVSGELKVDTGDEKTPTLEFYFDAHAVEATEDDYADLEISEHKERIEEIVSEKNPFVELSESIAPGITGGREIDIETPWGETYGKYWWIRLATGIGNLFGSWRRPNGDGTYQRGDSHILMIGDPSTGKSTIMNAVSEISPRSAYESGKNASGAGLTAAAVNDNFADSQWSLEAGALVKAHNGVAAIDEIDKMDHEDLDRLHSALEKQRLEFNKAGIDATLKCETSMLASGNPKGSRFGDYDSDQSQIDIVESLLDRFDLVFTLKDKVDRERDETIAESKIKQRTESGLVSKNEIDPEEKTTANAKVEPDVLRSWVAHARQSVDPVIVDEDVQERIKEYYVSIRQENAENGDNDDQPVPATARTLDGIMRLAEASARMRLSEEVEVIDAEMAIALVKVSLEDIGYDPDTGKMDADWAQGRGSWSQQQRIEKMKGIIDTLETDESGADPAEVIETAISAGMGQSKAEATYTKLKQEGEIYEPRPEKEVRKS